MPLHRLHPDFRIREGRGDVTDVEQEHVWDNRRKRRSPLSRNWADKSFVFEGAVSCVFWRWPAGQLWILLGKGGVDAPSRNIPVPLKGADGVVRSNSTTISFERTTPSAPVTVASRNFLNGRSHPSFPKEGNSLQTLHFGNNHMRILPRALFLRP